MEIKLFFRTEFHSKQNFVVFSTTGNKPNKEDGGRSQGTKSCYPSEQTSMGEIGIYASNFELGLIQLYSIGPFQPTWLVCEVVGF